MVLMVPCEWGGVALGGELASYDYYLFTSVQIATSFLKNPTSFSMAPLEGKKKNVVLPSAIIV